MMLTLRRDTSAPDATLGVLEVQGKRLFTIERGWVEHPEGGPAGAPYVSRIPPGQYRLEAFKLPSGEKGYILSNPANGVFRMPFDVPKEQRDRVRARVTIRAANYAFEAVDAIGVGMQRVKTPLGWKLERSLDAMNTLRTVIDKALDLQLLIEESERTLV
jgi:hypothetical protein